VRKPSDVAEKNKRGGSNNNVDNDDSSTITSTVTAVLVRCNHRVGKMMYDDVCVGWIASVT